MGLGVVTSRVTVTGDTQWRGRGKKFGLPFRYNVNRYLPFRSSVVMDKLFYRKINRVRPTVFGPEDGVERGAGEEGGGGGTGESWRGEWG